MLAQNLGESILGTHEATRYEPPTLARMIEWLDDEQREWGIGHVVLRTAEVYATHLIAAL